MSGTESPGTDGGEGPVDIDVEITDERTVVTVAGDRDAAVVVRSASGEQIYLPPEDFDRPAGEGQGVYDSPYQSAGDGVYDSPYQSAGGAAAVGIQPTMDGFRIVHPEPITDFRLLR